jgi:X-Pro dipeptidyl-peptidase
MEGGWGLMEGRMRVRGVAAGALAVTALALGTGGVAQAQTGPVLDGGKTKAVYNYKTAVRQRVFIPQPGIDADRNGADDWVTADIIRPAEASADNKMPAIIDPSPYYTTLCRGNESQCMADLNADGVNDRWPLFYDNYFLPRGYAYVLAQMNGTGYTTNGCPMHGGPTDIAGEKSVVDWLNGRVKAYSAASLTAPEIAAPWHNGSSAMIGKSYDGTLSNGVAATGVEGLKTIVPISAISAWYNYSRTGGVRHNTNYPGSSLNPQITFNGTSQGLGLPDRRPICQPVNNDLNNDANTDTGDGDAHGDINTFWRDRDYNKDFAKIKASVFAVHGFQDDNVRMDHEGLWWDSLEKAGVEHKLWLLRAGHTDPFESRRSEWVTTLHRWFDHYLYGVNNGIQAEPRVTVEEEKDVWKDYTNWPINGTQNEDLYLRGTADANAAGTLGGSTGGAADSLLFTARTNTSEATLMNTPTGSQANRRVFLSRPLTQDVRLSGTATVDLVASLGSTQSNVSVVVADYGQGTQGSRSGEGISNTTTRTCWGDTGNDAVTGAPGPDCTIGSTCTPATANTDTACYLEVSKPTQTVTSWRVTRGIRDSANRDSLWFQDAQPVTIGQAYHFKFPVMPTEHIFKAGHQIAVIVAGSNTSMASGTGNDNVAVTLDTKQSKVTLPIQGGYATIASAQGTDAETVAPTFNATPDVTAHTSDASGTVVNYTLPTATDNEDPNPTVTCVSASGTKFTIGSTVVTCTAKDTNGNTSTKSFNVIVGIDSVVGGSVPATLALTLGAPVQFGAFTPGVAKDYTAGTTATVLSTAGDATLSVADPSATNTGKLVNGTFALATPLQGLGVIKTWTAPTSNEVVPITFKQSIAANEPLRTGTYSKTLTFTLSTTTP